MVFALLICVVYLYYIRMIVANPVITKVTVYICKYTLVFQFNQYTIYVYIDIYVYM